MIRQLIVFPHFSPTTAKMFTAVIGLFQLGDPIRS
jgi:hypothetical protein